MPAERFSHGRYEAVLRNGRVEVDFMAGGDEEQNVDMTIAEARALGEWLGELARAFAVEPQASIVNDAIRKLGNEPGEGICARS